MKFVIKIDLEEKDQFIHLYFNKVEVIDELEDWNGNIIKDINKYEGKIAYAIFLCKSRLDNVPLFEIDTTQIDRDDKISIILDN